MCSSTPAIFIDGEAGTTGLGIRQRLAAHTGVTVKSIASDLRKDPKARRDMMAAVDVVILCLPDAAAREAVALADDLGTAAPRILDASTAHRVAPDWVFGFPELVAGQGDAIRKATRVSVPGCYPTGAIALLRPLVDAGVLPVDYPVTVNAVSGYSGGGKAMIEAYESRKAPDFELYGLGMEHKHLPELQHYARLARRPIFIPSVANYRQGMLVSVPFHLETLQGKPRPRDLVAILTDRYRGSAFVKVVPVDPAVSGYDRLEPQALNDSNVMELRVFGSDRYGQAVLVARLDNLGKGASGAAVQNLDLMLGLA